MSKGGSEVKETSQQRAMTEFAVNQLQDYTKRWLPLQKRLAAQTMESGAAGSAGAAQAPRPAWRGRSFRSNGSHARPGGGHPRPRRSYPRK